jgi:clan AA aspartic protease (TIGR02281 family)
MAFRGGMRRDGVRRAMNEAGLWLAVASAGAASFYFFEDVYRVVERQWPGLQSSVAQDGRIAGEPVSTESTAQTGARHAIPAAELRRSVTDFDAFVEKVTQPGRTVTLTPNTYGHYIVEADIGGASVELLTDTGATYVALNYETALQLGFTAQTLRFTSRSSTANGIARVAPVTLDYIRIGSILVRDVKAVIAEPGKMTQNLLGMSFINRLAGFELRGGRLLMVQNPTP